MSEALTVRKPRALEAMADRLNVEPAKLFEEGKVVDVHIQSVSKRGDGVAREGKYIIYVPGGKPGQTVKIRVTRISGSIVFTERAL